MEDKNKITKNKDSRNKSMKHNKETIKIKKNLDINKLYDLIDKKNVINNNMFVEKEYIDMMRQSNFSLASEIKLLKKENSELKKQILKDKTNIYTVNFNSNISDTKNELLQKEIEILKKENELLNNKLEKNLKEINDLELKQKNEGFLHIENNHLKNDLARLSKLLMSTKEYQELGTQADSTGAIRYLKEVGYFSKLDLWENTKKRGKYHCDACLVDEKYLWIPKTAYNFAHKFMSDFNGKFNETHIEYLLFEINKIFTNRENEVLKATKARFNAKLQTLKKKLKKDPNYDLKEAVNEIKNLKKELKVAKREKIEYDYKNNLSYPKEMSQIEKTLKLANNINSHKRQHEKEVKKYKNCCSEIQSKVKNDKMNTYFMAIGSNNSLSLVKKLFDTINERVNKTIYNYKNSNEEIIRGEIDNIKILSEKENLILDIKDAFDCINKEISTMMINSKNDLKFNK